MRHTLLLLALYMLAALGGRAQVVTATPSPVTLSSAPILVTFHADKGSRGLAGLGPTASVYAHTGVILRGESGWQKAPTWLDNAAKYRLSYAGPDTWTLTIPSIAAYYGLSSEELPRVERLMFVFRNADGSREGKTATGGDIAVDVLPDGLHISLAVTPESRVITAEGTEATVSASSSLPATIKIEANGATVSSEPGTTSLSCPITATEPGSVEVTATAITADGREAAASTTLLFAAPTATVPYPGAEVRQGVVVASNLTEATFALAAPGKSSALLIGSWNGFALTPSQEMKLATETVELPADTAFIKNAWSLRQPYFWTTVKGLKPGQQYTYYYLLDGSTAIGDPYATLVLDPLADTQLPQSTLSQLPAYPHGEVPDGTLLTVLSTEEESQERESPLTDRPALTDLIIYELLIRDFTGSGEADGSIATLLPRLDYIRSLGVNAVELMPIMEFGGNNSWGYNPLLYFAPDKAYGLPADYRRLIDEIHSRGMAVILDVVFNQADTRSPRQLMFSPDKNPFFNATPPHAYNVFHDWNQDNPLVFSQWADVLRYWVEQYSVDGFRFDLVKGLGDNGSYSIPWNRAANAFAAPSEATTNRFNASRAERIGRLKEYMETVMPSTYFICEDLADAREDELLASLGSTDWANVNYAACQFAMGYRDGADLSRFYAPMDGGRPFGSTLSYAESHDEERMAYKQLQWGVASVKSSPEVRARRLGSVAALMLLSPGPHMIWQFQELGDSQRVKLPSGDNDTSPRRPAWDLLGNPVNATLLDTYRALIRLRRDNPGLFTSLTEATVKATPAHWDTGYSILLADGPRRLALLVNPLTDRPLSVATGLSGTDMEIILASPSIAPTLAPGGETVTLAPGAFAVVAPKGQTGALPILAGQPTSASVAAIYDMTGRRIAPGAALTPGVYIMRLSDGRALRRLIK
ncbi:MAG: alpha-amylase family glycosyl hydrolase [Pseudoflavonifractor sp.]|nr:alpha-amylase family glycosyl hydrolase [Alloprevotella sp.]MCM1117444.1 alpha-amylase family glycosyl hydrolase [Pseudoflavonifractor sp.]